MTEDAETYALIGAAMEVHGRLGSGFLEHVYHEAYAIELTLKGIAFTYEVPLPISYRGKPLKTGYRADFVCSAGILVEIKALKSLTPIEVSQCINYLKAANLPKCVLLNFGAPRLEYKRLIHDPIPTQS